MLRFVIGSLVFLASSFLLMLTVIIRCLPALFRALLPFLRILFSLSVRTYKAILFRCSGFAYEVLGVNVLNGPFRSISCILLSVLLGSVFIILLHINLIIPILILSTLHGLVTHMLWDELGSGNMRIGSRMD